MKNMEDQYKQDRFNYANQFVGTIASRFLTPLKDDVTRLKVKKVDVSDLEALVGKIDAIVSTATGIVKGQDDVTMKTWDDLETQDAAAVLKFSYGKQLVAAYDRIVAATEKATKAAELAAKAAKKPEDPKKIESDKAPSVAEITDEAAEKTAEADVLKKVETAAAEAEKAVTK